MRHLLAAALLAAALAGCGSGADTPAAVLDDATGGCDDRSDTEDVAVCDLDGHTVAVTAVDDPAAAAYMVALSMDAGEAPPWLIGDGWVLSTRGAGARAPEIVEGYRDEVGGDVVYTVDDLTD